MPRSGRVVGAWSRRCLGAVAPTPRGRTAVARRYATSRFDDQGSEDAAARKVREEANRRDEVPPEEKGDREIPYEDYNPYGSSSGEYECAEYKCADYQVSEYKSVYDK